MIIAVSANKALSIKRRGCGSKVFKVLLGDYNFVVSFFFKSSRDGHRAARCSADMRADDKTESHDRICGGCFSVCKIKQCRMKHGPVSPPEKKPLPAWTRRRPWSRQGQNIWPALESCDTMNSIGIRADWSFVCTQNTEIKISAHKKTQKKHAWLAGGRLHRSLHVHQQYDPKYAKCQCLWCIWY